MLGNVQFTETEPEVCTHCFSFLWLMWFGPLKYSMQFFFFFADFLISASSAGYYDFSICMHVCVIKHTHTQHWTHRVQLIHKRVVSLITLISKDDIIHHLMSIIPCIQFLVQGAVGQLRRVSMHVCKRQPRHSVCECVRVKGVCHVGVVALYTVYRVKHAANQEAVAIVIAPETCAEVSYGLKVSGVKVDEQDDFLVEALCVQSRVEHPQARLIYSKLHLEHGNNERLKMNQQISASSFKLCWF